jgi:FkbM family methyltransferase
MRDSIQAGMRSKYTVQAYPLYSLILAMGITHIDFLSLDVEGAELDVLNTVPWDKVDIELVMVEVGSMASVSILLSIPCLLAFKT